MAVHGSGVERSGTIVLRFVHMCTPAEEDRYMCAQCEAVATRSGGGAKVGCSPSRQLVVA
eukprot:CAMPEP_0185552476 /NCGR_PEP_ID=MMETSP1381-20130426/33721_1 /TAXON_ID=298111 /ORGANISM="Pavlova sp., Strain CCMP459" /LENGTH=59 /DNA_ID=CAMNT_0028165465 /DNA_START=195 /DNA_END=374 /DNA_ORIENTATION=+